MTPCARWALRLTQDRALAKADCVAILTRHRDYGALTLERMQASMRTPVVVDGRNLLDDGACQTTEIIYRGIGKGQFDVPLA